MCNLLQFSKVENSSNVLKLAPENVLETEFSSYRGLYIIIVIGKKIMNSYSI